MKSIIICVLCLAYLSYAWIVDLQVFRDPRAAGIPPTKRVSLYGPDGVVLRSGIDTNWSPRCERVDGASFNYVISPDMRSIWVATDRFGGKKGCSVDIKVVVDNGRSGYIANGGCDEFEIAEMDYC